MEGLAVAPLSCSCSVAANRLRRHCSAGHSGAADHGVQRERPLLSSSQRVLWGGAAASLTLALARGASSAAAARRPRRGRRAARRPRFLGAAAVAEWQELEGCEVLVPSGSPERVVHFVGGVFAGAAPKFFYRRFCEQIAEEASAVVIVTGYRTRFDHDACASEAGAKFDAALAALRGAAALPEGLPVIGVGHSLGALLILLLSTRQSSRCGSVLISFNQRPVSEAIPVALPPAPTGDLAPVAQLVQEGAEEAFKEERLEAALRRAGDAAEGLIAALPPRGATEDEAARGFEEPRASLGQRATKAAAFVSQFGGVLGDLAVGTREFQPAKEEIRRRIMEEYTSSRTLVVQFGNDAIDETPWVLDALKATAAARAGEKLEAPTELEEEEEEEEKRATPEAPGALPQEEEEEEEEKRATPEAPGALSQVMVEYLRCPGGHTEVLDLPRAVASPDREGRAQQLAVAIGRFSRGEKVAARSEEEDRSERTKLKELLLRLTAGTNRGLSVTAASKRAEILSCVEQLEALAKRPSEPVPKDLFGNWNLLWATSPDVLLLAALPLVDCGEIRQDIPPQEVQPDEPLEVLNSVVLSPRGAGLLPGLLPGLADAVSLKATVRALAEPREGALSIRFVGGSIAPCNGGWPGFPSSLPLPTLPSARVTEAASGVKLLTTFVDSEIRVARSPLGDCFVLLRIN